MHIWIVDEYKKNAKSSAPCFRTIYWAAGLSVVYIYSWLSSWIRYGEYALNETFHEDMRVSDWAYSWFAAWRRIRSVRHAAAVNLFYCLLSHHWYDYCRSLFQIGVSGRFVWVDCSRLFSPRVRVFCNDCNGRISPLNWNFRLLGVSECIEFRRSLLL